LPPRLHLPQRQQPPPLRSGRRSVWPAPPLVPPRRLAGYNHLYRALRHPVPSLGDGHPAPKSAVLLPHMQGSKKQLQHISLTEKDCSSFSHPRQAVFPLSIGLIWLISVIPAMKISCSLSLFNFRTDLFFLWFESPNRYSGKYRVGWLSDPNSSGPAYKRDGEPRRPGNFFQPPGGCGGLHRARLKD
jgi:hypothetical protein